MKRSFWIIGLFVALAPVPLAGQNEPVRVDQDVDCGRNDGQRESYCESREYRLPAVEELEVDARINGGIEVTGWDRDEIQLIATIRAWSRDNDPADVARGIEIRTGSVIEARRDRTDRYEGWSVSFELMVPRDTEMRLNATNGGITMTDLTSSIRAQTTNGGLRVVGGAGDVRGGTTNGGIRLELTGETWRGAGVDLRTTNGGVTVMVPEGYSAVLETGTVNGGMTLDFPIMVQGRLHRTLRTELGDGGPVIRVETTNGGVSIRRP